MNNSVEQAKPKVVQKSICINCQQLVKKENQKVTPGLNCYFCEKFVCFDCSQKCSICEFDFCRFCSDQLYEDNNRDKYKCLNC